MARYPLAFGNALTAADLAVHGAIEVAVVGKPRSKDFDELVRTIGSAYVPSRVLAGGEPDRGDGVALLANRGMRDGRATAYVCRNYVCAEPVTDAARLFEQLRNAITLR
jgi:uncharacterized protein YyaL (SSP411 family)